MNTKTSRLQYIKENLDLTDKEIAQNLGIPERLVVAIRMQNGLRKRKKWTFEDDQFLYENYEKASWGELRERFPGVSPRKIMRRANKMGVYKRGAK